MLVYLILAIVSGLSPWVASLAVGIAATCPTLHEAIALPAHRQAPDELLYLSRVEAEPDAETKAPDRVVDCTLPPCTFFDQLLAACYSARPPVNSYGPAVPFVRPTPLTILHQVFLI